MPRTKAPENLDLSSGVPGYRWKLPKLPNNAHLARDRLQCRVDFYEDTVVLFCLDDGKVKTKVISARDITLALLSDIQLDSGILPDKTIFWMQSKYGVKMALWRQPQIWKTALQLELMKPPRRFKLPMPGLVFVCQPGQPPAVYAAKRRPVHKKDMLYHAPLFNIYPAGASCQGTHKYPNKIGQIPESFFASYFTQTMGSHRSNKFPNDLLPLWEELDGKRKFPVGDLVEFGPLEAIMK